MHPILIKGLQKIGFLQALNTQTKIQVFGKSLRIPIIKSLGRDNIHLSELWMCQVLENLLKISRKAFMDVGVNIGQTLIKLKSVDRNIVYYGFEPNPMCVQYVKELIKLNDFLHTNLFPVGIANEDQFYQLAFFHEGETDPSASIVENFRPNHKVIRREFVACFSYDTIKKNVDLEPIGIVKIDVEGGELEVITGLLPLIQSERPFILVEILPSYEASNTFRINRQKQIEEMLKSVDYSIFRIYKTSNNTLSHIQEISEIGINSNLEECDYILIPNEMKGEIINIFKH